MVVWRQAGAVPGSLRVAVAGLGAVGMHVARSLAVTGIPGLSLAAVSASDPARATGRMQVAGFAAPVLPLEQLPEQADVVVEALPPELFLPLAEPALRAGRTLVALTGTQVLAHYEQLLRVAGAGGGRLVVPTGALVGLDAVRAAAEGEVRSVVMRTRKPPAGLARAPFVLEQGIDLLSLEAEDPAVLLYSGSVREAAGKFPANVNVAVALALAGVGPDKTHYELWADPTVERNTHTIAVDAEASRFEMSIEGVPSPENPATGLLTPLSAIATLRTLTSVLVVGG